MEPLITQQLLRVNVENNQKRKVTSVKQGSPVQKDKKIRSLNMKYSKKNPFAIFIVLGYL